VPTRTKLIAALLGAVAVVGAGATVGIARDTGNNDVRPLKANQTEGFFDGQNQVFTYAQNFHCTIEAFDDLDGIGRQGDGVPAAADPDEMIIPECTVGETAGGAEPTIDPTGIPVKDARRFFAIVPVFDADGDAIPEFTDPNPGIALQCPEPGPPSTEDKQPLGSCTTHPSFVFIDPILAEGGKALTGVPIPGNLSLPGFPGKLPVDEPFALPTVSPGALIPLPGHSHIIETELDPQQTWWQVIVNIVEDPAVWPDLEGNCPAGRDKCLTSVEALRAAQTGGGTGHDIPTNIWLFFTNEPLEGPVGPHAPHPGGH